MGIGRREGPEALQGGRELPTEPQRIEVLIERLELGAARGSEHAGGAETLVGRLGAIMDAAHPRAVAVFAHELLDGLEEVDVMIPSDSPRGVKFAPHSSGIVGGPFFFTACSKRERSV